MALANAKISATYNFQGASSNRNALKYAPSSSNYKTSSKTTEQNEKILRNEMEMKKDGSYHYQYETSNGIVGMEHGLGGVAVQGANSYISPEGVEIKTTYTADENGYHPVGDHIPKIPDYILRALEYIRTHPPKDKPENYKKARKAAIAPTPKISTHIAPPTRKSTKLRRQTPTTKRLNSFGNTNKFTSRSQYNHKRY